MEDLSASPKPHPSKTQPLQHATSENRSCAAVLRMLRYRSCTATLAFLQCGCHLDQKLSAASAKLQCNIEKAALQFRRPRLGPAEFRHLSGSHRSTHIASDLASRVLTSQAKPQRESESQPFCIARSQKNTPIFCIAGQHRRIFAGIFSGIFLWFQIKRMCFPIASEKNFFASLAIWTTKLGMQMGIAIATLSSLRIVQVFLFLGPMPWSWSAQWILRQGVPYRNEFSSNSFR